MTRWLTDNWGTKLISLILAVGLWYYAVGEEKVEVTRTLTVEIKIDNEKMSIVGTSTRVAQVTFQTPRSLLANLTSEELKAQHRIKKIDSPGDYSFRLEPSEIRLPSDQIRVVRIEPEVIEVKVDEMIVQKLQVEPIFLGEPAIGYRLEAGEVQLDPNSVLIEGPKSQIEKLGKIKTQPIDLVGRVRSFRKTVRLDVDPGFKVLTESLVDAYVPIREAIAEKTFENIPVKILGAPASLNRITVEPGQVNLIIKGMSKDLEVFEPGDILAYVEVTGLPEGVQNLPLQVRLPPSLSLKDNAPTIKVTLQHKGVLSLA